MSDALTDDELEREVRTGAIKIHPPEDFEGMRVAGKLAAECLDMIAEHVKPGVTTGDLDDRIREFVLDHDALSATIGYRGYRQKETQPGQHREFHVQIIVHAKKSSLPVADSPSSALAEK